MATKLFETSIVKCLIDTDKHKPIVKYGDETFVLGKYTQQDIFYTCLNSPFPGSSTYEADHPIWDCWVGDNLSPKEGWKTDSILQAAIRNWFYMICYNEYQVVVNPDNKDVDTLDRLYIRYNNKWLKALNELPYNAFDVAQEVLNRFTVSKLAPRVTAISGNKVMSIMEESGLDFTDGVYCPMGGFNGIPDGVQRWAKRYGKQVEIEVYDINPIFCEYFGYKQRDVTAQHIETDKTVIVCSPFSSKDEHWKGTPDVNAAGINTYCGFQEWCYIITEYIKAPNYIFIGPTKASKNSVGLFSKATGVAYYPEYINGAYRN